MALQAKKIGFFSPYNRRVKQLLKELFPARERMNMLFLRLRTLGRMVDYMGYYDESNTFCGFSYVIHTDRMAFILFLAVDTSIQSKGYGSEIMRLIMCKHAGKEITLNCESQNEAAENAAQRERRIRFYERLGLHVTDWQYVEEEDDPYSIMSTGPALSVEEYRRLMKSFSFGLYHPKVRKVSGQGAEEGAAKR